MPIIAGSPIIRTNDMTRLIDHARELLAADPRLLAITVRALTSRWSNAGPNPDYEDDVDVRGLDPVDVIYHLKESPAHEFYEPVGPKAMAAAFVVERQRGLFARAVYDVKPDDLGGDAFVTLIGSKAAGVIPNLSSLHTHILDPAETLRYFPIFDREVTNHERLVAARCFEALVRQVSEKN